jgi:hypothetical protein
MPKLHPILADPKAIPWSARENCANFARFALACLWTFVWGTARWLFRRPRDWPWKPWRRMAFSWNPRQSPRPRLCAKCGWVGPLRWARFEYDSSVYGEECTLLESCPRCANQECLLPALGKGWS